VPQFHLERQSAALARLDTLHLDTPHHQECQRC
jgi:hypothetical protein